MLCKYSQVLDKIAKKGGKGDGRPLPQKKLETSPA